MSAALVTGHQREYHHWIEEAKKPETHAKRIATMCELLSQHKK
ncbi:YdeI/OmpD-associated family protein [Candidatus Saccharibacteria bacterium]|nr:YdeI/OmpD-associated family protein [Candidatus Saccharibacteria bacterium]